ncbi:MAG: helix-hairpin-helix domain-containing protein [Rudaea sp.]
MNVIRNLAIALILSLAVGLPAFAGPVNINSADALTLSKNLKGVGANKAQAIVAYRKEHGHFAKAADLAKVKGIGLKTVERNRDVILLDDTSAKKTAVKDGKNS